MDSRKEHHPLPSSFGVRDAISFLRNQLGTYSNHKLNKDLAELCEAPDASENIRALAQQYAKNKRGGIARELLDAIVERQFPPAPEGHCAIDPLCVQIGMNYDRYLEILRKYLRIKGVSDEDTAAVLKDSAVYKTYADKLASVFLFARGKNGAVSAYFTPQAQQEVIRMAEEWRKDPSPHTPHPTPHVPKRTPHAPTHTPSQPPRPEGVNPESVRNLRTRIVRIIDDLDEEEKIAAREILLKLTNDITHQNADYYARQIRELETAAVRNRRDRRED